MLVIYISCGTLKEELSINQELLKLEIVSFNVLLRGDNVQRSKMHESHALKSNNKIGNIWGPSHPNISKQILLTFLYTFPVVLTRRVYSTINPSQIDDHFLYSYDPNWGNKSVTLRRN